MLAIDHSGKNVTALIDSEDSRYWESDLANITFNSSLQDGLELRFARPENSGNAALLIDAINTELITSVYQSVFSFLGDDALLFLHKLETDSNIIALMHKWLQDCALHVSVWNNGQWEPAGSIFPEANAVPFQRLVYLQIPESSSADKIVRIRLHSLPDVWKINSITLDWMPERARDIQTVPLHQADGPGGLSGKEILSRQDQDYAVLLPGDKIDLWFENKGLIKSPAVTAVLAVSGYLHEWLRQDDTINTFSLGAAGIWGNDRLAALTYLMNEKRLLLPPIYSDWKNHKLQKSVR